VAALHGKRLVVISETDDGCSLAEAQVKEITSNERIAARKNYGDVFEFLPSHKILLLTNHRPFVKGTDEGIWRRLNIVGFNVTVSGTQPSARRNYFRRSRGFSRGWSRAV
jgi:putative DNA primase/helicase